MNSFQSDDALADFIKLHETQLQSGIGDTEFFQTVWLIVRAKYSSLQFIIYLLIYFRSTERHRKCSFAKK